jgi:hypothetical protein
VHLYVALSLGWWATLLAWQERPVAGVMAEMARALVALDELATLETGG